MNKVTIKNCTIYHGDCFEILPEISEADCMITDPPYGCTKNDWDYDIDLDKFWELGKAACKKNAPFVIFCQMPFAARLYMSNPKEFKYEWIYKKARNSGWLDVSWKPMRQHEMIYVFGRKKPKYNPQKGKCKRKVFERCGTSQCYGSVRIVSSDNLGESYPGSIIDLRYESNFYIKDRFPHHPTHKPIAVLSYLIKTYTDEGNTVIDPFMGSGTTGVAAVKHGRKFIGID